mmetsp:Transcript_1198/g.2196  ORF Transcript_1198/g.2196 Transcript_1198/m.2196 type:complete len:291 (-) Transcript_1198:1305-2177(-)
MPIPLNQIQSHFFHNVKYFTSFRQLQSPSTRTLLPLKTSQNVSLIVLLSMTTNLYLIPASRSTKVSYPLLVLVIVLALPVTILVDPILTFQDTFVGSYGVSITILTLTLLLGVVVTVVLVLVVVVVVVVIGVVVDVVVVVVVVGGNSVVVVVVDDVVLVVLVEVVVEGGSTVTLSNTKFGTVPTNFLGTIKSLLDKALPLTSPEIVKSEIFPSKSPVQRLPGFLSPLRKLFVLVAPPVKNSSSKNMFVMDIFLILPTQPCGVRCLEKAALLISSPTAQLHAVSTKILWIR